MSRRSSCFDTTRIHRRRLLLLSFHFSCSQLTDCKFTKHICQKTFLLERECINNRIYFSFCLAPLRGSWTVDTKECRKLSIDRSKERPTERPNKHEYLLVFDSERVKSRRTKQITPLIPIDRRSTTTSARDDDDDKLTTTLSRK